MTEMKHDLRCMRRLVGYWNRETSQVACKACITPEKDDPWVRIEIPSPCAERNCCRCGQPLWAMMPTLFDRLKAGETLNVHNPQNGKEFTIVPVKWHGIVLAYSFLVDGIVERGYDKIMLSDADVRDMCAGLEEVTA